MRQSVSTRAAGIVAFVTLMLTGGAGMAYEEPSYEVVRRGKSYEIRRYAVQIVAEVTVPGGVDDAGNRAFGPLFRYIDGANVDSRKIPMTAPVTQYESGKKIAMTAPVTQREEDAGSVVQFLMPKGFSLETTPRPKDPSVTIREIPSRDIAVVRYSGRWTESSLRENEKKLRDALAADHVDVVGPMEWARYNSPYSLPWFRRNEVWIPVRVVQS
ncbi:MAG: heme-binding protein [Myxococcota bacterium]